MFRRFLIPAFLACGLGACAPTTQTNQAQPVSAGSIGITSVSVSAAPSATIFWPSRAIGLDQTTMEIRSQYASGPAINLLKRAYEQEFRGAFGGPQRAHITVQIASMYVMSEKPQTTRIGVGGVGGLSVGSVGGIGISSTPSEVSVRTIVNVVENGSGAVIASTPITTVISPNGVSDVGAALLQQNALDAKNWLIKMQTRR